LSIKLIKMKFEDVKFDCKHFRTGIPCKPSKTNGVMCNDCSFYTPISKRILIIKLGALGDVIRTTPLLTKYKELYPNAHITWITMSPAILPATEIDVILKWDASAIFIAQHSKYDIAINLDKEIEACLLLRETTADVKYGYTWENDQIAPASPKAIHKLMTGFFDQISQPNTKSYLEEIFDICELEFNQEEYLIHLDAEKSHQWKAMLHERAEGRTIVGLNTGCGPRWNTRLWQDASWTELAKKLREAGFFPVFLGGELEHERNTKMAHASESVYPGHFPLQEFIALTSACDIVVTQVTMMMHIATALQKKLVLCNTIFNDHEFELYGRGVLVSPPTPCKCYFGNTCVDETPCMYAITPDDMFAAVLKLKS
jgi:ADP-heptose:LPS heptosyltransferase